ncbi:MAG: tRNA (cytidine(34)-2'-O)-methyltransferase [Bacilli bacterium]
MINIVLFEPEKPANVGNIIRTCMAMDAHLIIIGELTFSMSDKALKRAGMDYIIGFDIERERTIEDFLSHHKNDDIYFVTRYAEQTYTDFDYSNVLSDVYFMFGRESSGIPHDILRDHLDRTIRIPMAIDARSLNLSNSVAIVLLEAERQRKFFGLSTKEAIKGGDFLIKEKK